MIQIMPNFTDPHNGLPGDSLFPAAELKKYETKKAQAKSPWGIIKVP
jgi:hypothetical protein